MAAATTSVDGYLTSTDWNTFNNKGSGTVTSVGATSPVTSTGGTTPTIAMPAATTSVNGYLTSTDWNTFNNKTSNLGTVTSVGGTGTVNGITLTGTVTTSGNLTLGGTLSGVSLTTQVSGTLPVANGGTGTATAFTAGSVVFAGASGVYSQDNAVLFYDDTNDRLGVGTTTPNQRLQVTGSNSTGFAGATLQNSNGNVGLAGVQFSSDTTYSKSAIAQVRENANGNGPLVFYVDSATDAADWASGDEKMRISAAGNVGIGTIAPAQKLHVVGTSRFDGDALVTTGYSLRLIESTNNNTYLLTNSSNNLTFVYNASERMRLDNSGNLLIGTTGFAAGQNAKHIAPNVILSSVNSTAANGQIVFYNPNGAVGQIYTDGTSTVYVTSSDYRLKEITGVVTATEAKDFIMALQPKQGTWKIDGSKFVGFLAHEFKNVSPSSVFGEKDAVDKSNKPVYQGMQAASSEVMANLIALVQEQQALITQLQTDVATLKGN
jgi:hypothetical protein